MNEREILRYSRQLVLPEWSGAAQERLASATAVLIGAGALGSPAATYMAAAGVGRIGIVDGDDVELSNLARQPLHFTPDVGVQKAESAARKLGVLNTDITVEPYPVTLTEDNADAIVAGADVVVDCSDSFETRYAVNDACCEQRISLVEGGVLGFSGMAMAIRPGESACYRCAFPKPPPPGSVPTCQEAGVLGPVAGVLGSLQALLALRLLTGVGEDVVNQFVVFDGLTLAQTIVKTKRRDDCTACAQVPAPSQSSA